MNNYLGLCYNVINKAMNFNDQCSYQVTDESLVAHARVCVGHLVEGVVLLVGRSLLTDAGAAQSENPVAKVKSLKVEEDFIFFALSIFFKEKL